MDSDDPKIISRHMFAALSKNSFIVEDMVDRYGLSFVPEWGNGYELLCHALRHRCLFSARMLIRKGAEVNALSDASSPLVLAIRLCSDAGSDVLPVFQEHAKIIQMLLDRGAKVNIDVTEGSVKVPLFHLLLQSFKDSNCHLVEMFLQHGADVNAVDSVGQTALFHAVTMRSKVLVELFLRCGAKVNVQSSSLLTPLHVAVQKCSKEVVEMLLNAGMIVDCRAGGDATPLQLACDRKDMEGPGIVELLISRGAKVNLADDEGVTALHAAAASHTSVVELLLSKGADINAETADGRTPLHCAAAFGHIERVHLLLEKGAAVNATTLDLCTPLHYAILHKHTCTNLWEPPGDRLKTAAMLLERGADVNAKTKDGKTCLLMAVEMSLVDCEDFFSPHKLVDLVDVILRHKPDRSVNPTCVQVAVRRCETHHADKVEKDLSPIVEKLLEYGFSIRLEDVSRPPLALFFGAVKSGFVKTVEAILELTDARALLFSTSDYADDAALHAAVRNRRLEVARLLLRWGADVNAVSRGRRPLDFAIVNADVAMFQLLVSHQADVKYDRELLLHAAIGRVEIVECLLQQGAYVNVAALHAAVRNRRLEIARLLLMWGADVNVESGPEGERPLDSAIANADVAMFQLLVSHQADVKYDRELLLHAAVGRVEIVEHLLQQGAYVNVRDRFRNTALHLAVGRRFSYRTSDVEPASDEEAMKIARLLLRLGAKVNVRNIRGKTPLMEAADGGSCELASLFLDHHADVNMRDTERFRSALDRAVENQNYELSKLLLERGARMNFRDERCESPLHSAVDKSNLALIKLLMEYCIDENALSDEFLSPGRRNVHALRIAMRSDHIPIIKYLLECTDISLNSCMGEGEIRYPIDIEYESMDFMPDWRCTDSRGYFFLVRHIVKLKAANLYVNHANSSYALPLDQWHSMPTSFRVGRDTLTIAQFADRCKAELAAMQNHKIQNTSLSFDSILRASTNKLVSLSGNEDLKKVVSEDSFLREFPIYGSWIRGRLSIGERRRSWYEKGREALRRMSPTFPCDCIEYVLDYLPIEDIRMLILASQAEDRSDAYPPLRYRWYLRTRKAWVRSLWPKAASRAPTKRKVEMKEHKRERK